MSANIKFIIKNNYTFIYIYNCERKTNNYLKKSVVIQIYVQYCFLHKQKRISWFNILFNLCQVL